MKKKLLILSSSLLFAWDMQGFTSQTNPPDTKTWCYNANWENNFHYKNYPQINKIQGGEACWVYNNISLKQGNNDTYKWKEGWNFVTPVFTNWNLNDKFRGNAKIGWKYKNNKWEVYNYNVNGIHNFNTLNIGEGMFVYIPKIDIKINTQPLFCTEGKCSNIITSNKEYKFYLKAPQNKDIKFAFDLYRYSNNTHYKFAIGPFKIVNNKIKGNIPVCVEKESVGGSCGDINNTKENIMNYANGYLLIDAQQIAKHFHKSIPDTKEKFLVNLYTENFSFPYETDKKFGTLGIENFGTWVSLNNSKKIEFEMEIK